MSLTRSAIEFLTIAHKENPDLLNGLSVGKPPYSVATITRIGQEENSRNLHELIKHIETRVNANRKQLAESNKKPWGTWQQRSVTFYPGFDGDRRRSACKNQTKRGRR